MVGLIGFYRERMNFHRTNDAKSSLLQAQGKATAAGK